jgi:hypothetical protein
MTHARSTLTAAALLATGTVQPPKANSPATTP